MATDRGRTSQRGNHRLYVAPNLSAELILSEHILRAHKAQLKFDLATLIVGGREAPLEDKAWEASPVVAKEDIKLPPRTAVFLWRKNNH